MSRSGTAKLSDVEKLKDLHGFSDSTLKRAKSELLIKSVTVGFGEKVTYWLLPEVDAEQFRQKKINRKALEFVLNPTITQLQTQTNCIQTQTNANEKCGKMR